MKKGSKEMLRTILSNQELIMKALKIEIPAKPVVTKKSEAKPVAAKSKPAVKSKARKPAKKASAK